MAWQLAAVDAPPVPPAPEPPLPAAPAAAPSLFEAPFEHPSAISMSRTASRRMPVCGDVGRKLSINRRW
jgi:hypothetical protein